jgi:hypothetical protein
MCILQSKYDCYRYIFPIRFCCKHSNTNFSQKPCFKLSKILLTLSWIQYVLTFIPVAAYFVNLPSVCQRDQYLCVFLISDQVFGVSSLLLGGTILFKLETQRQELAFWLSLFENHNSYNLGPIICGDDLKKFQLYRLLSSYSFLVEGILSFLIYFYALENNLPWTFLKQASLCFACSLQGKGVAGQSATIRFGRGRRPRGPTYARGTIRSLFEDQEQATQRTAYDVATRPPCRNLFWGRSFRNNSVCLCRQSIHFEFIGSGFIFVYRITFSFISVSLSVSLSVFVCFFRGFFRVFIVESLCQPVLGRLESHMLAPKF